MYRTHTSHIPVCVCFSDHFCVCQTKEPFHTQSSIYTQRSAQKLYHDFISLCRNYFYANDIIRPMEFCCDGFGLIFLQFFSPPTGCETVFDDLGPAFLSEVRGHSYLTPSGPLQTCSTVGLNLIRTCPATHRNQQKYNMKLYFA